MSVQRVYVWDEEVERRDAMERGTVETVAAFLASVDALVTQAQIEKEVGRGPHVRHALKHLVTGRRVCLMMGPPGRTHYYALIGHGTFPFPVSTHDSSHGEPDAA